MACGEDLAGRLVAHAARTAGAESVSMREISFLQLSDCCGTQAEFALARGQFNMAVLCPDAAEKFLASGVPYRIFGGLIRNGNVLVSHGGKPPRTIGYMNGRNLQKEAVLATLGPMTEFHPITAPALPYALESGAVEAVVLDAGDAIRLSHYRTTPLPYSAPTSVLLVREDLMGSKELKNFVKYYNKMIGDILASRSEKLFSQVLRISGGKERLETWNRMNVQLSALPEGD